MTAAITVAALAICLSVTMMIAWLIAIPIGRSGWADAMWSLSTGIFAAGAAVVPFTDAEIRARQVLVAVLALLWSLRLGTYVAARTARGVEDPRYGQLRAEWGHTFNARLFWFLQIQALAAFALALTIVIAAHNPAAGLQISDWCGLGMLIIAVAGETVADRQLAVFRANPSNKGGICQSGLWGVSRHPNYFFEWLGWVAYAVIAIDPFGNYRWGWLALAGPILMYWLLVHVSGIPPLEAHMLRSRKEAFRDYQHRVNAFWPGLPGGAGGLDKSAVR